MRPVTLKDAEANVRSMCGSVANTVQPETIRVWLKEASEQATAALDWVEAQWSFDTEVDETTYRLPDDLVRVEYVTWDNYRMKEIDRREWSELSQDGQDDGNGDPAYYILEQGKIVFYPKPDEVKTVVVRYRKKPTRLIREHRGNATSGSTATVSDTGFSAKWGIVNNRENAEIDFFNGCRLKIVRDSGGANAAPEGEESTVISFNEATGTFTLDDSFSAEVASGDTYELQDVLEVAPAHAATCQLYAAARLLLSSADRVDVQKGMQYQQLWAEGLERLRTEAPSKSRDTDRMMRIYTV
jgi:hypothetical protein